MVVTDVHAEAIGIAGGNENLTIEFYYYLEEEYTQEDIERFQGKIDSGEYLEGSYVRVEDGVTYECIIAKRS